MIFETHAHYDDAKFDTDREMLLAELPQRGISPVINVGSSIATTKTTLSLAQEYPFLYAAVGVHPSDVDDLNEDTYPSNNPVRSLPPQLSFAALSAV